MKRLLPIAAILPFLLLIIFPALCQVNEFPFSKLDIRDGLPNNQVNAIYKDRKGFMWFGTLSGLARYDGYSFKIFRHDIRDTASLPDDLISRIWEGPGQCLWITTHKGLALYDPLTEKFNRNPQTSLRSPVGGSGNITDIRQDPEGYYWFLVSGSGFYQYSPSGELVDHRVHNNRDSTSLHTNELSSFAADSRGDWWIVGRDGLIEKMDHHSGKIVYRSDIVQKNFPRQQADYRIFVDTQNECWVYANSSPDGIFWFNPSGGICRHLRRDEGKPRLNTDLVTGVVQDEKGLIWIATDHGGIDLLDKKDFSLRYLLAREDDEKTLCQNSINSIYRDNTGILWLGTYKKGASYYHEDIQQFPLYSHQSSDPASLPYNDVNRFVEDGKGNLWIGTNGGGLIYLNRTTGKYTQYLHQASDPGSLCNDVIVSLCLDHEQRLWIGTYFGGLDCFNGKTFVHYRHKDSDSTSLGDDRVWEIREDSRGRLWIGTLAGGLDLFDRQKNVFHHYHPILTGASNGAETFGSVHSGYISELMEDREGNLWVGTDRGIDVLEAGTDRFRHYANDENNPASLSNNNVVSIMEDSRGLIWTATRDGLNLFDKKTKTFTTFRVGDGLPDNAVLTILEDNNHELWLGTPNGLSHVILSRDGPIGRYTCLFENYDPSHGLQGREFNENAALRTRTGEMIFGGASGFNIFNPRAIRTRPRKVELALTDFQVFNKSVGIGEKLNGHVILPQSISASREIKLRYNENVFSIAFASLDFLKAEKIRYAYTLDGFNKGWLISDDKTRKAVYTNLDPGKYKFRVRTINEDGSPGGEMLELGITILPPFWKTPLAYFIYALVLTGILVFARRMIIRRAHARFALQQERLEARRLHELDMMKIRFFTNVSHEFRTPLSLILTPLDKIIRNTTSAAQKDQFHLIYRNARRLLNMVNQLLDFRKLEVQELRLNPSHADIVRFIKELSFSFADIAEKKNIDFDFDSPVAMFYTSFDQDKLERIVFNLLSNAFKFTPEHGRIRVAVQLLPSVDPASPRLLQLTVKDTGIGIEKDKQERIFERFFQNDVPNSMVNQGSGIGLAITKEFVKLHNGSISVESELGKGACFTMRIPVVEWIPVTNTPVHKAVETAVATDGLAPAIGDEIENGVETGRMRLPSRPVNPGVASGAKKPAILLVEDNEDFRFYLKDNLKEYFTILEASNGREGWQKTLAAHPVLVVSDISMPEMTGIDLCRKIKNDTRTSFVPVILLTALSEEDQQLKGLETGANDYMTKPFNFEILLSRIRNLLAQQETSKKTWQKQVETSPASVKVVSPDEKFVREALELIEKNISNADFSVEEMSRELFLSRVALYKKVLALTGKTPIELIRSIRLKRAVQLLEKNSFTIAEIAYEVGYNDPKYFSRHFKAEFGVLPSTYSLK